MEDDTPLTPDNSSDANLVLMYWNTEVSLLTTSRATSELGSTVNVSEDITNRPKNMGQACI